MCPPLSPSRPPIGGAGWQKTKGTVGVTAWVDRWVPPAGTTVRLARRAFRGRTRAALLSFGDEGAVGTVVGIMASCFLSMGRWLLCALAEGDCRRGNVLPLPCPSSPWPHPKSALYLYIFKGKQIVVFYIK